MSKTTHYELNTPIGSEVLSVMTGLNPNFTAIDRVMYDNETRSTQALNKANVNEQNIATALGRITTAEGNIDTLESGLETANTNISGLTSRVTTAESGLVSANNRIQENTNQIAQINAGLSELIIVKNKALNSFTISANGYSVKTLNISESGYIPMMASIHNIGSGKVNIPKMDISDDTLTIEFDNNDANNSKTIEPSFYVLYKKA